MRKFLVALLVLISLATQAQIPNGSAGIQSSIVVGPEDHVGWTTGGRPTGVNGRFGWNITLQQFEYFAAGAWHLFSGATGAQGPPGTNGAASRFGVEDKEWGFPAPAGIARIFNMHGAGSFLINNVFNSGAPTYWQWIMEDSISPSNIGSIEESSFAITSSGISSSTQSVLFNNYAQFSASYGGIYSAAGDDGSLSAGNHTNLEYHTGYLEIYSKEISNVDSSGFYITPTNFRFKHMGSGLRQAGSTGRGPVAFMLGVDDQGDLVEVNRQSTKWWFQTALVSGTKAVTIAGLTNTSMAWAQLVSQSGAALTAAVRAPCTTNTVTVSALTNAGNNTVNTSDNSTYNIWILP